MKKYLLAYALAGTCLYAQAQSGIRPLTIGDTVPDITFNNLLNYPAKTAKLSDFRGKLVILDFWATWCASCVNHFPQAEALEREFRGNLKFILINSITTTDRKETVSQFLKKRIRAERPVSLTITSEDSAAGKLFPHTSLPHYAWVNGSGVLIAITGPEELTGENIRKAISSESLQVHTKRDMDLTKRIYLKDNVPKELLRHYALFFKGRLLDLNGGGGVTYPRMNGDEYEGILFGNTTLYQIYTTLAGEILENYNNDPVRIKYSPDDSSGLYFSDYRNKQRSNEWHTKNVVTLELYAPSKTRKELFVKVLEELNNYSDYRAEVKIVKTKCYVLKKTPAAGSVEKDTPKVVDSSYTSYGNIWDIKSLIVRLRPEKIPLIDQTGYSGAIQLPIPVKAGTLEELKPDLQKLGLILQQEEVMVPMLFITKK